MNATKALPARHCQTMENHDGHTWKVVDSMVWCPGTASNEDCGMDHEHDGHSWFSGPYGEQPFQYCPGLAKKPAPLPDGLCGDESAHSPHDWIVAGDKEIHCVGVTDTSAKPERCEIDWEGHPGHNWVPSEGGELRYCSGGQISWGPEGKLGPAPAGEPSDLAYIRDNLVAEWWELYESKALDYNDGPAENHRVLGIRGQFSDLWRKMGKLKKAIWDGKPLATEQPREILMDQISHCFLMIAMMDDEEGRRG